MTESQTNEYRPTTVPIEDVARAFEKAFRAGTGAVIDDFLQGEGPQRWDLLLELVERELDLRLRRAQPAQLSEYLVRYPELLHFKNELAAILATEIRLRLRAKEVLSLAEYEARYPDLGPRVREIFRRMGAAPPEVPGYEILDKIGQGGMGAVYRARHVLLKREVALKVIRRDRVTDPKEEERHRGQFRAEAEAVAKINHPHVVQIFETGESEGDLFIAMELIDGPSLQGHLDRSGVLDPTLAATLMEKVARAVHVVHAKGIVHRDLKPDNVLLAANGEPKIGDFGLARPIDLTDGHTVAGWFVGTPEYSSPEQAEASGKKPTESVDVYGIGAVLYACLTKCAPFPRGDLTATLEKVRTQPVVPIRSLRPEVHRDLETVCLKCLQKEPQSRYASAAALADDLRRWLDGKPILARPVGTAERAWKWCRRNKLAAVLLAGLALVILAGTMSTGVAAYLATRRASEAEEARDDARDQTRIAVDEKGKALAATRDALEAKAQVEAERDRVRVGLYQSLTISADRAYDRLELAAAAEFLDECPVSLRKFEWFVRRANVEGTVAVLNHRGFASAAAFANKGTEFATCGGRGQPLVRIWDASAGRLRDSFPAPPGFQGAATAAAVSSDGKWVAVHSAVGSLLNPDNLSFAVDGTGTVHVFDRATKKVVHAFAASCFAFSPDGSKLAFGSEQKVAVLNLANGTTTWSTSKLDHTVFHVAWHPDGKVVMAACRIIAPFKPLFPPRSPERENSSLSTWDLTTGKLTPSFLPRYYAWTAAALEPSGKWIAVAEGEQITVISTAKPDLKSLYGTVMRTLPARFGATAIAIRPDGKQLAAGGWDGRLRIFDLTDGSLRLVLHGHRSAIRSVAYSPDGTKLLTAGGKDETVRMWDANRQLGGPELLSGGGALAFHPTERTAAFPDANGNVQIWDLVARRTISTLPARQEWAEFPLRKEPPVVFDLAYRADGQLLVAYSDGRVRTWNPATRTVESERELAMVVPSFLKADQHWHPTGCRFSRDAQWVAAFSRSPVFGLNVFSMVDGRRTVATLLSGFPTAGGVGFDLSGQAVRMTLKPVVGTMKGDHAWELNTGREVPPAGVRLGREELSPDNARVATVSADTGNILIRDASNNRHLVTLAGVQPYQRIAFSPDGAYLAAIAEGRVELYDSTARPVFWSGE